MTKWKLFLTKLLPINQRVFLDTSMHSFPKQLSFLNFSVSGSTIIIFGPTLVNIRRIFMLKSH